MKDIDLSLLFVVLSFSLISQKPWTRANIMFFTENPSKHFAETLRVDIGSNQVKSKESFVAEKNFMKNEEYE